MAPTSSTSFTAREIELLTIAFQCLKGKPDIDYNLFAAKADLKGAKSARDSFTPLYNKIVAGSKTSGTVASGNGGENGSSEASSSPKKATPKKRKAGKDADSEALSSPTKKATPRKTTKGKRNKRPAAAADSDDDAEDGEDSIVVKSEYVEPQAESDE